MIIVIKGVRIQVAIINEIHLVMDISIIKENVKVVASFQVADEIL
ncbi:hypothetical protein B4083_5691 [Bacillus cereus]|nr:hypothetical protein B4083_5691 [Bacillus cereus]